MIDRSLRFRPYESSVLGPCQACSRPLHDHDPLHVGHIGLGQELICGACHEMVRRVTRFWMVKTRRLPGRDTPPRGLPTLRFVEPSARILV